MIILPFVRRPLSGRPWTRAAALLALCVGLAAPAAARADNLDAALVQQAPRVMQYLRSHGYHNVGVLKFRVQKGQHPPSLKVGPLNANLAVRLENALVLNTDKGRPLGIIHDANQVATDRKLSSYARTAGQQALFQQRFPLAWGNETVKADAFLTGIVVVSPDLRKATVTVEALTPEATHLDKVVTFPVATDRPLLADIGETFVLNSRSVRKKRDIVELAAIEDSTGREEHKKGNPLQSRDNLLDFAIHYDGVRQEVRTDPETGGLRVNEPREGQKVKFGLKNISTERIGVVLRVNGKSTLYFQEDDPKLSKMWILDPGDDTEVPGFKISDNQYKEFRVLSDEKSAALAYSEYLGMIHVHVFVSVDPKISEPDPPPADPKNVSEGEPPPTTVMNVSRNVTLRGVPRASTAKTVRPRSLPDLQAALRAKVSPTKKRGAIDVDEGPAKELVTEKVSFSNPEEQMTLVIRYFTPKQ